MNVPNLQDFSLKRWPAEVWVVGLALVLYLPFMGEPVLRTTGDEKVYVAQALEMHQRASWFLQTLAEVPNYYKGPLHYILLRLGYFMFGIHSLWSALWMNIVGLALAGWVLTRRLRLYWQDNDAALWVGFGLILAPGVFAHSFASQMEIELTVLYAFVLSALLRFDQKPSLASWTWMWLLTGLASWLKSPLHSVLLGLGILLYTLLFWRKLKDILLQSRAVLSILLGILVASSAFLIPWWLDQKAFYQTYILRETVGKGPNGVGILESLLPNLSYHILPLAPLLLASLGVYASWVLLGRSTRDLSVLPGTTLAFLLALPTFVFFAWHPYRSEIYTLPAIPAVLVATVGLGRGLRQKFPKTWFSTQLFALSLSLLPSLLVLALHLRFSPTELWWPSALGYLTVCGLLLQVCVLIYVRWIHESNCSAFALLVWIPAFLSVAFLMKVLGHEDLKDLKYISAANPQHRVYGFYNAEKFVWSEWGLLNLSSGLTIQGLHDLESVRSWVMAGHPIIVKDDEERLRVEALAPELSFEAKIWFRWASHGLHSQEKNPRQAWLQRDLKLLRQKSYVMTAEEKAL